LVVDKKTGCFNATKMCADGGKEFRKWARLEKSKRLMEYYKVADQIWSATFYEVKGGNCNDTKAKTTGQYVCKELILDIASWVSVEFYDKCNRIIVDFYVADFKRKERAKLQEKDDKIDELMKQLKESDRKREESDKRHANMILRLEESNKRLGIKLDDVLDKNDELLEKMKRSKLESYRYRPS